MKQKILIAVRWLCAGYVICTLIFPAIDYAVLKGVCFLFAVTLTPEILEQWAALVRRCREEHRLSLRNRETRNTLLQTLFFIAVSVILAHR